jgi:uncharacterized membrane protein
LCEECAVTCDKCNTLICGAHIHETPHGRKLCINCWNEREARHAERRRQGKNAGAAETPAEETGFAAVSGEAPPEEEEEAAEERVLVASRREPPPPWKISLWVAGIGLVAMLVVLVFSGLRTVPMPGGASLTVPYILLIVPAFAVLWAVIGLLRAEGLRACLGSIGIALVTVVLAVVAVQTDPARAAAETEDEQDLTPQQRREQIIDRFRGPQE